jgi:ABC-type sulfate/molybdate transport systems ATPase subunit
MLTIDLTSTTAVPARLAATVADGTLTVLFGPSGAGKTTVLRMVAGLHPATGRLAFDDDDWTPLPPWRRSVGYVAQGSPLFPHWTVARQIAESAARPVHAPEVLRWLELWGLSDLAERRPAALSGGQRQRAALARALARRPRVLLLDEPLGHLDDTARRELGDRVKSWVRDEGAAALMATHDWGEVERLADEVVLLNRGRAVARGLPDAVFQEPQSLEAARLLGYREVGSGRRVIHPARAEWTAPASCPVVVDGIVRAEIRERYGFRLWVDDGRGTAWEAFWPGPEAPRPGTRVVVGFWAPEVVDDDR